MKKMIPFLATIFRVNLVVLFSLPTVLAQQFSAHLSKAEYYLFVHNEVKDIRDFSTVFTCLRAGETRQIRPDTLMILGEPDHAGYLLQLYDKHHKLIYDKSIQGLMAPNWRYVLYLKQGDVWRKDLNWRNGQTYGDRQITQLGIFQRGFPYLNWYGDIVFFRVDGKTYRLNTKTQELKERGANWFDNRARPCSPSGRYFPFEEKNRSLYMYDFRTDQTLPLGRGNTMFWYNDHEFLLYRINHSAQFTRHELYVGDMRTRKLQPPYWLHNQAAYAESYADDLRGIPRLILPDNYKAMYKPYDDRIFDNQITYQHLLFNWSGNKLNTGQEIKRFNQVYSFDFQTGKRLLWDETAHELRGKSYDVFNVTWSSAHHVIYTVKGDLTKQGTWVRQAQTGQKRKITPYLAERYWSFQKVGITLFLANDKLYRCKADGSELKMLSDDRTLHHSWIRKVVKEW